MPDALTLTTDLYLYLVYCSYFKSIQGAAVILHYRKGRAWFASIHVLINLDRDKTPTTAIKEI